MQFKQFIKKLQKNNPDLNIELIKKAYEFSSKYHKDHKRESGEPYITHPLDVAIIVSEIGLDSESIATALLHDTIEDTEASLEQLEKEFGAGIKDLVDGLTKLSKFKYRKTKDTETIRKLLIATGKDLRVIMIKLADKLHNMRTLKHLKKETRVRISKDVLDIYAPLASRVGMYNIKAELEDLAFKNLHPEVYERFSKKFSKTKKERENDVKKIKNTLEKELKKRNIKARIFGRPKHLYSLYKKMILKKRSFKEIYDLVGLRIITDKKRQCYEILGIIHSLWTPIPGEFTDYIAMPKKNMYQSLHTGVMALNQPVEFQIRTENMDRIAEEGVAAHWKYKGISVKDKRFDKSLSWIRDLMKLKKDEKSPQSFRDALKIDFLGDEIYIFTPESEVISLPHDSTPVDFAYAIHSDLGDKCSGAIVNGRIVSLRHKLKHGDIVKIITKKESRPRRDWLKVVKTTKARAKIKRFLRAHKEIPTAIEKPKKIEEKQEKITNLFYIKDKGYKTKISKCCSPLPGDEIIAYKLGKTYSIHKKNCKSLRDKPKSKLKKCEWQDLKEFETKFTIKVLERVGVLADIVNTIAATGTSIVKAKIGKPLRGKAEISITLKFEDLEHLKEIVSRIKRLEGILTININ
jgi:guanosine-3',5'-bis(diphosphate) 3'-pyrophosphohydrolase